MALIKYFWGFDSTVEGWTGDNVVFEESGGGMLSPHIYGSKSLKPSQTYATFPITFKSPRGLGINAGDVIAFIFSWDGSVENLVSKSSSSVVIEFVDSSESVLDSVTVSNTAGANTTNTALGAIVKVPVDCVGFNVKVNIYTKSGAVSYKVHYHYARLDSVVVYGASNEIIYSALPSTLQSTLTHEIPLNKSGSYVLIAGRLDDIQNFTTYDETLTYDGSTSLDYANNSPAVTVTSSIDKVSITHNADSTPGVYYTCEHMVVLYDASTLEPEWLTSILLYHNQNITNPDTVTFNPTLDGTSPYTETQTMSLKFVADGLFDLRLTPSSQVSGDTSGVTTLTATIAVKDSGGSTIDSMTYDILGDSYDKQVVVDKSYDGQDLTLEITINADGQVSETVAVSLNILFEFIRS